MRRVKKWWLLGLLFAIILIIYLCISMPGLLDNSSVVSHADAAQGLSYIYTGSNISADAYSAFPGDWFSTSMTCAGQCSSTSSTCSWNCGSTFGTCGLACGYNPPGGSNVSTSLFNNFLGSRTGAGSTFSTCIMCGGGTTLTTCGGGFLCGGGMTTFNTCGTGLLCGGGTTITTCGGYLCGGGTTMSTCGFICGGGTTFSTCSSICGWGTTLSTCTGMGCGGGGGSDTDAQCWINPNPTGSTCGVSGCGFDTMSTCSTCGTVFCVTGGVCLPIGEIFSYTPRAMDYSQPPAY